MTPEKKKSLMKYMARCQEQLNSPIPSKHIARGSTENYKKFLTQEIETVKAQLKAAQEQLTVGK